MVMVLYFLFLYIFLFLLSVPLTLLPSFSIIIIKKLLFQSFFPRYNVFLSDYLKGVVDKNASIYTENCFEKFEIKFLNFRFSEGTWTRPQSVGTI
jgi:hypothetical protein